MSKRKCEYRHASKVSDKKDDNGGRYFKWTTCRKPAVYLSTGERIDLLRLEAEEIGDEDCFDNDDFNGYFCAYHYKKLREEGWIL